MTRFPACVDIGFLRDLEVEIEASVDFDNGEPRVVIDGVYAEGQSLIAHDDPLMKDLGLRIADIAEDDDALLSKLMEAEGIGWTGNGANDPSGRFVPA